MQLLDDIFLEKSLSEESLSSDFDGVDFSAKKGKRTATDREIVDDGEGDDLFDFTRQLINKKAS